VDSRGAKHPPQARRPRPLRPPSRRAGPHAQAAPSPAFPSRKVSQITHFNLGTYMRMIAGAARARGARERVCIDYTARHACTANSCWRYELPCGVNVVYTWRSNRAVIDADAAPARRPCSCLEHNRSIDGARWRQMREQLGLSTECAYLWPRRETDHASLRMLTTGTSFLYVRRSIRAGFVYRWELCL
jgi:hypothetical protein